MMLFPALFSGLSWEILGYIYIRTYMQVDLYIYIYTYICALYMLYTLYILYTLYTPLPNIYILIYTYPTISQLSPLKVAGNSIIPVAMSIQRQHPNISPHSKESGLLG